MLTIALVDDKDTITEYCKNKKLVYSPALYMYVAKDKNAFLATGVFEVKSDTAVIFDFFSEIDDYHLFDGILRAGYNFANEQGIPKGEIPECFRQRHKSMFDKLNYPSERTFNIDNFFSKFKNCSR